MNIFFRMSEEQVYPPSQNFLFQNKVIGAYETAIGFTFDKKYKNKITGNLGNFDRTMSFKVDNVKGGGHGTVKLADLDREFFAPAGSPITGDMAGFVFGVIDHNSAHHMSYVLARRAFSGNTAKKKIIVNFDRHQDYGSQSTDIACDTWAYFTRNGSTKFADGYVAIGTYQPSGTNSAKYSCAADNGSGGATWLNNPDALLSHLGITGQTKATDVALYITVDRDWTTYSRTPYGDGYYTYDKGYDDFLLPFVKKVKSLVISADIIGLPGPLGHSTYGDSTSYKAPNDYGKVAAKHIKDFYSALQ